MRWLLAVILEVLTLLSAAGAEPIRVQNKCVPTFVVQNKTQKAACICGDSCKCAAGECPSKCPVATVPPGTVGSAVTYRYVLRQGRFGRTWYELEAVPTPTASGVIVGQTQCVGFK